MHEPPPSSLPRLPDPRAAATTNTTPAQHNLGVWEYIGRSTQQVSVSTSADRPFFVANLQAGPIRPDTRNENSMMYDVYSEENRRLAMQGAIETGHAFSSDFVQLVPVRTPPPAAASPRSLDPPASKERLPCVRRPSPAASERSRQPRALSPRFAAGRAHG